MAAPDRIFLPTEQAEDAASSDNGYGLIEYIRLNPAVLARDETVLAMVGAVIEEAAGIVRPAQRVRPVSAKWAFADDILESRYLSIRALRPDAAAALAARDKRIRDEALEEAAKVARNFDGFAEGAATWPESIACRIEALKGEKP